jgi:hypothetical protein
VASNEHGDFPLEKSLSPSFLDKLFRHCSASL